METTTTEKMSYWYCDQCGRVLKHGEFRFNCIICDNYDLCTDCLATLDPPHPHRLIRDLAYGSEEKIYECERMDAASLIQITIAKYTDRYCLGVRDFDKSDHSLYADTYSWLTFEAVGIRSRNFGQGLRSLIEPRGYLGICSKNRPEWLITDFACIIHSIISVPIYSLFNDRELAHIINNTQVSVVVCDEQMFSRFIQLHAECPSLQHIICMDFIPKIGPGNNFNCLFILRLLFMSFFFISFIIL